MSLHEQHVAMIDSAAEYTDVEGLRILVPRGVYHPRREIEAQLQRLLPDYGITIQKDASR
jgi:hypothetical protein